MNKLQVLIHTAYWVIALITFIFFYSLIDSVDQAVIYACVSLPLIIGVTYLFIHRVVPNLLFKERYVLFTLLTSTIFLGVLNIMIVLAMTQRLFLADDLSSEVAFIHGDIVYLMISTILLSLPAIAYESLRNWTKKQKEVLQLHQKEKDEFIELRCDGKTYRIACNNIRFIESYGDYAYVHLENQISSVRLNVKESQLVSLRGSVSREFIV